MPLYEEVEIEDLSYDPDTMLYTYACPCGDVFKVTLEELWDGEDIARCPSCTLFIQVIYEEEDLPALPDDFSGDEDENDDGNDDDDAKDKATEDYEEKASYKKDGPFKSSLSDDKNNETPSIHRDLGKLTISQ